MYAKSTTLVQENEADGEVARDSTAGVAEAASSSPKTPVKMVDYVAMPSWFFFVRPVDKGTIKVSRVAWSVGGLCKGSVHGCGARGMGHERAHVPWTDSSSPSPTISLTQAAAHVLHTTMACASPSG